MTEKVEIDLKEIGRGLLKYAWLIVLCAVLVGAAVLFYTRNFVTPVYQSGVELYVNHKYDPDENTMSSNDYAVALRLVNSYARFVKTDVVLERVLERIPTLEMSTGQLASMISTEVVEDTEVLLVKVRSPHPQMSADIANVIAEEVSNAALEYNFAGGSSAACYSKAKPNQAPVSPNYVSSTILGLFVGAMLASVAILVSMCFDVHVKNEKTLEEICKAPVLGVIPDFAEMSKGKPTKKVRRAK